MLVCAALWCRFISPDAPTALAAELLVTHTMAAGELGSALEVAKSKDAIKVVYLTRDSGEDGGQTGE